MDDQPRPRTPLSSTPAGTPAEHTVGVWARGLDGVAYGGDYNPEQWPEEVWAEDVRLMREAGVTFATVGVFSWVLVEPREGVFEFGWLDRLVDLLHANGIRVVLGTPTTVPPAWFYRAYPEARVVTRDGVPLGFGSRGMVSPSSPQYREAAVRVTTALAERYGSHPALALWHVHNEYGVPVAEDYSEHALHAFRDWLRARYGSLDALNARWGTAFWGQRYGDWDEVGLPAAAASVVNPAERLDFARFSDHQLRACFVAERDAIRAHSDVPITTNFMAFACGSTDLWAWGREVDVVSNDHYLDAADPRNQVTLAQAADLTRSVAQGNPWFLMEHSTSAVNWQPRNVAKQPGELRRNSLQHVARGADAVGFFQWRASRSGAEKFHSAMLPHAGTGSRVWREVVAFGADLGHLAEVAGSRVEARVAVLWDQESAWAQGLEWRPSVDVDARERTDAWYRALWDDHVTVDFAHPSADLSSYALVVAPASYLLTADDAANLTRYVAAGGTLVVSYFSGIVDENDAVHEGGYGAPLRDALGLTVEEFAPLRAGDGVRVAWSGAPDDDGAHRELVADTWTDHLALDGAEVVATYVDGPVAGGAAVTRHALGDGHGWYVSTRLDDDGLRAVLAAAYQDAGLAPRDGLGAGTGRDVEIVERTGDGRLYTFVLNHGTEPASVPVTGDELLTGSTVDGWLKVPAGEVAVVRSPR
ncbi:beta-galactosidase [Luteimicrobium sp. DT211]|uniref:beta-galactosidase n=1 Tax=Luteimicrobium sp. DT211 TaxID=3393412 RepID=UPI003CFA28C8